MYTPNYFYQGRQIYGIWRDGYGSHPRNVVTDLEAFKKRYPEETEVYIILEESPPIVWDGDHHIRNNPRADYGLFISISTIFNANDKSVEFKFKR